MAQKNYKKLSVSQHRTCVNHVLTLQYNQLPNAVSKKVHLDLIKTISRINLTHLFQMYPFSSPFLYPSTGIFLRIELLRTAFFIERLQGLLLNLSKVLCLTLKILGKEKWTSPASFFLVATLFDSKL